MTGFIIASTSNKINVKKSTIKSVCKCVWKTRASLTNTQSYVETNMVTTNSRRSRTDLGV